MCFSKHSPGIFCPFQLRDLAWPALPSPLPGGIGELPPVCTHRNAGALASLPVDVRTPGAGTDAIQKWQGQASDKPVQFSLTAGPEIGLLSQSRGAQLEKPISSHE